MLNTIDNLFDGELFRGKHTFLQAGAKVTRVNSPEAKANKNPGATVTLSYVFENLFAYYLMGNIKFSVQGDVVVAEGTSHNRPDRKYYARWDKSKNKLEYFLTESGVHYSYDRIHWALYAPLLHHLLNTDSEVKGMMDKIKGDFVANGAVFTGTKELLRLSDTFYYEKDGSYPSSAEENIFLPSAIVGASAQTTPAPVVNQAAAQPTTQAVDPAQPTTKTRKKRGSTAAQTTIDTSASTPKNPWDEKYGMFKLPWSRALTDLEKSFMINYKLDIDVIVPEYIIACAKKIFGEIKGNNPINNVLLFGDAAVGKSTSAKILAQLLGIPYYSFDISKGVDETMLTAGVEIKNGTMSYNFSQVVQAVKFGGVLELREVYAMKADNLIALNGLLEEGTLRLANGETIQRHKNCIIVGTTNISYAACQDFDWSTDDRFRLQYEVMPMPREKMIKLVQINSGNSDITLIGKLIDTYEKIMLKIKNESIDGVATMRKLYAWAQSCKYETPREAALCTIIPGVTKDRELRQEIYNTCITNTF